MKYSDVLKNKHFNNLAAIIRVPFLSETWRSEHANIQFWSLLNNLNDVKTEQAFASNKQEFVNRFCAFLVEITSADLKLSYTKEDMDWFVAAMDSEQALAIVSLLFAWFSAPDTMLTPAEVAAATSTAESTWRNKAASREIPGAEKKGKQWLLPKSVLVSWGYEL